MSMLEDVVRIAGRQPYRVYRGIGLRVLAQACSIAPFFLAWLGLQWVLAGSAGSAEWWGLGLALGACLIGQLLFSHFGQMDCFIGAYDLMMSYRAALTDHLRLVPLGFFHQRRIGELAATLTDDVKRVEDVFTHLIAEVIAGISVPLIFCLLLVWVDWRLTLSLLVTLPLGWALYQGCMGYLLREGTRQSGRLQMASGLLVEFVSGIRTLRLFHRCDGMLARLEETFASIRRGSLGIEAWGGGGVQLLRLMIEMGLVSLLLMAAWLFVEQSLDVATWLLFVLVSYKIIDALLEVAAYLTQLRMMSQSSARLSALMAEPILAETTEVAVPEDSALRFEQVSFGYAREPVVQGIDFTVPAGSVTAIVGPSGSGKSTLLHLLGRFYDPQQGQITLGGVDLKALGTDALYQQVGFVFQDVQLFDGSVLDNVRIGRPEASVEAVRAACREAHCEAFIEQLEQGYDTPLGEGGLRLSGGERQRLSIARMLLKAPRIVLLDEATASVDPCAQADIQQALSRLAEGRTVVMIAHRLRTVEYADQILVLDQGRIVERGNHRQLLELGGLYRRLWDEQDAQAMPLAPLIPGLPGEQP